MIRWFNEPIAWWFFNNWFFILYLRGVLYIFKVHMTICKNDQYYASRLVPDVDLLYNVRELRGLVSSISMWYPCYDTGKVGNLR